MTCDVDAVISDERGVNAVGNCLELTNGWMNEDFKNANLYSPILSHYSIHYRAYYNVLNIRTVSTEYLIAMKLMSERRYKKSCLTLWAYRTNKKYLI